MAPSRQQRQTGEMRGAAVLPKSTSSDTTRPRPEGAVVGRVQSDPAVWLLTNRRGHILDASELATGLLETNQSVLALLDWKVSLDGNPLTIVQAARSALAGRPVTFAARFLPPERKPLDVTVVVRIFEDTNETRLLWTMVPQHC